MRNSLSLKFIAGDLSRSRGTTAVLAVLLILCATLMATGAIVMERLVGSMDRLFEAARPPHFLQMHAGGYDRAALERFAADHPQVRDWLIEEMVGLDGSALTWQRPSTGGSGGTTASGDLSDSLIDHLFVSQNATFDLLLDESGAAPRPGPGQVYVPVAVQQSHGLRTGDDLTLATAAGPLRLRIAGAVRDAQMASSLSSGSRFLISPSDLRTLQRSGSGSPEIIVEYRTADPSGAVDLQRAYESDPATPKNGQAVTFQMIRMINAFGDGLVAVALIMVSLVLIAISMLVLRFVIRGTLEDEVREIGALRAIGLSSRAVSGLYLAKYGVIATAACLVGGLLAVVLSGFLVRGVQTSYLAAPAGLQTVLVPLGALALVDLMVIALCHRVLREVRRLDVVEALVRGELSAARRPAGRPGRSRLASARGGLNVRLTLIDLAAERGRWLLVATVLGTVGPAGHSPDEPAEHLPESPLRHLHGDAGQRPARRHPVLRRDGRGPRPAGGRDAGRPPADRRALLRQGALRGARREGLGGDDGGGRRALGLRSERIRLRRDRLHQRRRPRRRSDRAVGAERRAVRPGAGGTHSLCAAGPSGPPSSS
ncbi:MAG: FtsX-like permease family protein [Acidipropionibacterium sp.]|jgi:putative ABC transport system permease protein|nr:FtsX-like permease family protein [Acidipropionibacterium sp.]